ncbi:MAG: hypothetical protein HZB42_10925 [Sphingobacteriales bacterium]|nr:hypothetical protein [Sphingobacteriales bacterium]
MKYFIILTTILLWVACSRNSNDSIVGRWEFEKFEASDKKFHLADSLQELRHQMERVNQGLIFSFQKDGKLTTFRRSGNSKTFISSVDYEHKAKDVVILKDTSDGTTTIVNIHFLSNTTLKLSFLPNRYDIGVFRKIMP